VIRKLELRPTSPNNGAWSWSDSYVMQAMPLKASSALSAAHACALSRWALWVAHPIGSPPWRIERPSMKVQLSTASLIARKLIPASLRAALTLSILSLASQESNPAARNVWAAADQAFVSRTACAFLISRPSEPAPADAIAEMVDAVRPRWVAPEEGWAVLRFLIRLTAVVRPIATWIALLARIKAGELRENPPPPAIGSSGKGTQIRASLRMGRAWLVCEKRAPQPTQSKVQAGSG